MKRPLGYADGLGTGVAVIGLVVIAWLASITDNLGGMYRDIGPTTLPATTTLVMSTAWRVGVPLVLVGGLVAGHVWRPRFLLLGVALATLATAAFWYFAAYQPIFAIAGNIKP